MNFEFLEGWKTYITALAILSYAIGGYFAGYLDINQVIPLIFGALGLGALKHATITGTDPFEKVEVPTSPTTPPETT